jgi:hypothetical protein
MSSTTAALTSPACTPPGEPCQRSRAAALASAPWQRSAADKSQCDGRGQIANLFANHRISGHATMGCSFLSVRRCLGSRGRGRVQGPQHANMRRYVEAQDATSTSAPPYQRASVVIDNGVLDGRPIADSCTTTLGIVPFVVSCDTNVTPDELTGLHDGAASLTLLWRPCDSDRVHFCQGAVTDQIEGEP